jgi:hypothetical protein
MSVKSFRSPFLFCVLPVILLLVTEPIDIRAGGLCCSRCRCERPCRKVCRLVCEDRKITTTCWRCQSEDVCIPGPSKPGCEHCETVCAECSDDSKKVHAEPKRLVWTTWHPFRSGDILTRRKLMKRTVTKTVPSYKWVVVDLCEECQTSFRDAQTDPGTVIPPKPEIQDKK